MGGKLGLNRALWWGAALWLCACDSGDAGAPPAPIEELDSSTPRMDSGRPRDGGGDGGDAARLDGEAGPSDGAIDGEAGTSLGPLLELLEPAEGAVVSGSTLSVLCKAEKNPDAELVNPASVKVSLYADGQTVAFVTQVANSTGETDVYKADVVLSAAPHGKIRVECSADDLAQQKHHASLGIDAVMDRGPQITFLYPTQNDFVKAGDGPGEDVRVRFKVEPRPISDDDDGAEIDGISVAVSGKPITGIEESSTEANVYSFGLDFSDEATFTVIPDTLSVRVDARNVREPAASASATLAVGVDSEGPTITVRSPVETSGAEPIVSGKVDIIIEVKDVLAGVDPASVEMFISVPGQTRYYPTESLGNDRYATTFEVGEYPNSSSLTINFYARDLVGIETTASMGIRIDDQPPWLSLDPGPVRELTPKTRPTLDECSGPFDPLGDAPNDGATVQKAVRLRTLAWDRPRVVSGQFIYHYALVDETSVDILVQHDTSVPLLVNSKGIPGGPCDAVNVRPAAGQTAPVVIELEALAPQGSSPLAGSFVGQPPVFVPDLVSDPDVSPSSGYECTPKSGSIPNYICRDPSITRIIKHVAVGSFPVVYGINVTPTFCSGDYYSNPVPGPLCMVAQARDKAGNAAFSWPMRLCVEYADGEDGDPVDGTDAVVSCPPNVLNGITCTDGCVLPTKFGPNAPDRMSSVVRLD